MRGAAAKAQGNGAAAQSLNVSDDFLCFGFAALVGEDDVDSALCQP
jgi:hypothetical protein